MVSKVILFRLMIEAIDKLFIFAANFGSIQNIFEWIKRESGEII